MNTVNLIGSIVAPPKFFERQGRQQVEVILKTKEPYLDKFGDQHFLQSSHALVGWGKWSSLLEKHAQPGLEICVQGSLRSKIYQDQTGQKHCRTEIEILELFLM